MKWGNWDGETKHSKEYFYFCTEIAAGDSEWRVSESSFFLLRTTLKFIFPPSLCQNFSMTESLMPLFCFDPTFIWTILSIIKLKAGVGFFWDKVPWLYVFLFFFSVEIFHFSHCTWVGERKLYERFRSWEENWKWSLTKYHHGQTRLNLRISIEFITKKITAG